MMTHAAVNAVPYVRYAITRRKKMSEPRLEDDVAFYDECSECGNFIHTCECETIDPDHEYDIRHED